MSLLDRIFRSKLPPEEEVHKAKSWQQIETLVTPALKVKPHDLTKVKATALKEIDEQIYYVRAISTAQPPGLYIPMADLLSKL